jgi:hypothetical protein
MAFEYAFDGPQSVKHLIESLRAPHTEVGHVQVNGADVDFSYLVQDGDEVGVYPVQDRDGLVEMATVVQMNDEPRFLLDNHLGRLATYLRMLGLDVWYRNDYQDEELARVAVEEERILLTRDRGLLMRKAIQQGYCLRSLEPEQQLLEVVRRFQLLVFIRPFQRCLRCNTLLQPVSKETISDRLMPLTRKYYDEFHLCPHCDQVYWKGSHYERMLELVSKVSTDT